MAQPIAAAGEVAPRDGLAGAVGYGVIVAERGADPLDPDGRWVGPGGYTLEGLTCVVPAYTASGEFCAPSRTWAQGAALIASLADLQPFVVGAAVECSTFGSPEQLLDEYRSAALRALELSQWAQIARELWTGALAATEGWSNPALASASATVLSATPVSIVDGVALLEQAHAECSAGEVQVIHAPRRAVPYADAEGIIATTPGSGRLWTANNSLVVADRGYPGTGPVFDPDADPNVVWLYSTGPLSARLGDVTYPERDLADAIAAASNDVSVRAERLAAISWLCCHLAVPVCLGS